MLAFFVLLQPRMKNISSIFFIFTFFFSNFLPLAQATEDLQLSSQAPPPKLPPLPILEEAALNRAGLHPQLVRRWQKHARLSAALPQLQVGFEQKALQQNTAVIQDSISVTSSGITVGPESNRIDQDLGRNRGLEVKAVWSLDALLFNRDELDISREARDLWLVRQRLLEDLHQHYYELQTLLLRMHADPALAQDPFERLKIAQAISHLESLTGERLFGFKSFNVHH